VPHADRNAILNERSSTVKAVAALKNAGISELSHTRDKDGAFFVWRGAESPLRAAVP
jgi:hypothetical protein